MLFNSLAMSSMHVLGRFQCTRSLTTAFGHSLDSRSSPLANRVSFTLVAEQVLLSELDDEANNRVSSAKITLEGSRKMFPYRYEIELVIENIKASVG